jgi:SAM-dependent methyltransferase
VSASQPASDADAPVFSAHNFELSPGEWTLPGAPPIGEEPISSSYLRTMTELCPPPARVADLGCLEGGYSVMLARAGYEVVGIEGQAQNFETCSWVEQRVGLPNLSFVRDDVLNIAAHGSFDAVLCAGLLYHLDQPVAYLRRLAEVTRRLLLVSTNYATEEGRELETYGDLLTSELSEHEGRRGRWFGELPGPWSSVGNSRSFWLERGDLLRSLSAAGFPTVFEQFDWIGDEATMRHLEDRKVAVFVALKPFAHSVTAVRNSS